MKLALILGLLCMAISALGTPVPSSNLVQIASNQVQGRQNPAQPAPAADDDDDDDDEDLDLIPSDDDDDDDEEDDDDDDDDYLERFFDDILGEDDDDDDETNQIEPQNQGGGAAVSAASQSIPVAIQNDLNEQSLETHAVGDSAEGEEDSSSYDEDLTPQGQAAASIPEASVGASAVLPQVPVPAASASSDDDDDDDEDDLEYGGVLEDEDDDDDDDADDGDDEDEDEDDTLARRARVIDTHNAGEMSAIYVSKYNRFVDVILTKINRILKARYDPVTVKLTKPISGTKSKKTKKTVKRKRTKSGASIQKSSATMITQSSAPENATYNPTTIASESATIMDVTEIPVSESPHGRGTSHSHGKKSNRVRNPTKSGTKTKISTPSSIKKKQTSKNKPRAKATLSGLASLSRSGDVSVNMMSDHTTIKTKFNLGPLTLKVEKEFGKSPKKELRSATATTAEMSGKLSLRVLQGGAATLHSIHVLQPKQVRVDSPDDHDRTREFVWKRSSHIAHLVSQKLSSATRSMLRPPPAQAA